MLSFKTSSVIFTEDEHALVSVASALVGLSKQDYLRQTILSHAKEDTKKTWPKFKKNLKKKEKQWGTGYHFGN